MTTDTRGLIHNRGDFAPCVMAIDDTPGYSVCACQKYLDTLTEVIGATIGAFYLTEPGRTANEVGPEEQVAVGVIAPMRFWSRATLCGPALEGRRP